MRVLIAGAGKTAREILRRLGKSWEIVLVDLTEDRFPSFKKMKPVKKVLIGDASSNIVLQEAEIGKADFFVATTNRDEINLEACILAQAHGVKNIISIVNDSSNLQKFREREIRCICGTSLVAHHIETFLESPKMVITSIGEGRGEVMEIKALHNSPAVGKSLQEIGSRDWLIGAIYREGEMIIPHGDTVIQRDDLVTVVGSSSLFKTISRFFTIDDPKFPLDYGQNILVPVQNEQDVEISVPEAVYLTRDFKAKKVVFLVSKAETSARDESLLQRVVHQAEGRVEFELRKLDEGTGLEDAIIDISQHESIGCVVTNLSEINLIEKLMGRNRAVDLAHRISCPLLVAKKRFPYKRILVPTNATKAAELAAEVAVDIGRIVNAEVATVSVSDPVFLATRDSGKWAQTAMRHVRQIGEMHHFPMEEILLEGNPVREVVRTAEKYDLIVMGSTTRGRSILKPNVGEHIIREAKSSILIVTS